MTLAEPGRARQPGGAPTDRRAPAGFRLVFID